MGCHKRRLADDGRDPGQAPRWKRADPLPRYFFHFSDGKRLFSDGCGLELPGVAAARRHAILQVRELNVAMCAPEIQDLTGWSMSVEDAGGRTVFEIGFDFKPVHKRDR